jgi:hypothetical protein
MGTLRQVLEIIFGVQRIINNEKITRRKISFPTYETHFLLLNLIIVATLALGLRPRQGVTRLWAKREAQESCHMLPGMQESVRE